MFICIRPFNESFIPAAILAAHTAMPISEERLKHYNVLFVLLVVTFTPLNGVLARLLLVVLLYENGAITGTLTMSGELLPPTGTVLVAFAARMSVLFAAVESSKAGVVGAGRTTGLSL